MIRGLENTLMVIHPLDRCKTTAHYPYFTSTWWDCGRLGLITSLRTLLIILLLRYACYMQLPQVLITTSKILLLILLLQETCDKMFPKTILSWENQSLTKNHFPESKSHKRVLDPSLPRTSNRGLRLAVCGSTFKHYSINRLVVD